MMLENNLFLRSLQKYKFKSLLLKMFISYLSILMIVVIAYYITYSSIKDIVINKEIKVCNDYLSYTSQIIDGEMKNVKYRMFGFLNNHNNQDKIKKMSTDVNSQRYMVSAMSVFKDSSYLINTCYLYNETFPYLISPDGSESMDYFCDIFKIYHDISPEETKNILENVNSFRVFYTFDQKKAELVAENEVNEQIEEYLPQTIITLYTGILYGVDKSRLVVLIDEKDIKKIILKSDIVEYGKSYIINNNGDIITSSMIEEDEHLIDSGLLEKIENSDNQYFDYRDNLVVYQTSDFFDGYYLTIIPYSNILEKIDTIKDVHLFVIIILAIICLIAAMVYSGLFYEPVIKLLNKFNITGMKEVNTGDEFSIISDIIENIQINNKKREEKSILLNIIGGNFDYSKAEDIFSYNYYLGIVIKSRMISDIYNQIVKYINNNFLKGYKFKVLRSKSRDIYIIANGDQIKIEVVQKYLSEMKKRIEKKQDIQQIIIGLGNICHEVEQISYSLQKAELAVKQGDSYKEEKIYIHTKPTRKNFNIYFPVDFENVLVDLIKVGAIEKIKSSINKIFEKNRGLPNIYINMIYSEFINVYIKIANQFDFSFDINNLTKNLDNQYNINRAKSFIIMLFCQIAREMGKKLNTEKRVEQFVKEYVKNNYQDFNLSIEEIASKLDLSSSYVSTLFKKGSGVNFSDYLRNYRIEKAMDLLIDTDFTVKKIAKKVGFFSYNSFNRVFKNKRGLTPGQFRKVNKKSNN